MPSPAETVVLTVCLTGGIDVTVLADGDTAPGLGLITLQGCRTRKLALTKITIAISGGVGTSEGTYALSLTLP